MAFGLQFQFGQRGTHLAHTALRRLQRHRRLVLQPAPGVAQRLDQLFAQRRNQCVQALYAGTCVRPGEAQYGRWGDLTLRLVPRRVEQSSDNSRFRTLAEQDRNCQFPGLN